MNAAARLRDPRLHRAALGLLACAALVGAAGERGWIPALPRGPFHAGAWWIGPWFVGPLSLAALLGILGTPQDPERSWDRLCLGLAPLLLLMGFVTTRFLGMREAVALRVGAIGEPVAALGGLRPRLDALRQDPRPPAFRLAAFTRPDDAGGFEGEPRALAEAPGAEGRVPGTALRYRVEAAIPHGLPNGTMADDPAAPENPALHLLLGLGQPSPLEGYLLARDPGRARFDEPGGRFAVVLKERFEASDLGELRARPARERLVLEVQGHRLEHGAAVGSTWELPSFALKVEAAYPDFVAVPGPEGQPRFATRSRAPRNPWLQVRLTQPGGASALLMLAAHPPADPSYEAYLREALPPGVTLRYAREGGDPVDRFALFTLADSRVRLVAGGKVLREAPLAPRVPFVVAPGLSATALEVFARARYAEDWRSHPDPVEASRFENPVMKARITDPATGASEVRWLAARGPQGPRPVAFLGGRLALLYKKREPEPEQLHATLSLLDGEGAVKATGPVEVGAPLRPSRLGWAAVHAGLATSNDPAAYQALAVREPGRPLIFLGLGLLGAGAAGAWRRRRSRASADDSR